MRADRRSVAHRPCHREMTRIPRRTMRSSPMWALAGFHLATGVRLSLRAAVPLVTLLVAAVGIEQEPAAMLTRLAQGFAGDPGDPTILVVFFLVFTALPSWAAPRVTRGLSGWIRHLPAD